MTADAREWIAAATERAQAAAPPYLVGVPEGMEWDGLNHDELVELGFDAGVLWGAWEARRKMPAVDALTAVLDLHAEDVFRGHLSNGCKTCGGDFPCPTVTAITTALEDA